MGNTSQTRELTGVDNQRDRLRVEPIDAERYSVRFTVSRRVVEKLERARALLSHTIPDRSLEAVLERCLDEALEAFSRRKYAALSKASKARAEQTPAPAPERPGEAVAPESEFASDQRAPSAAARREVWERAQGRCEFVGRDGKRCNSTYQPEFEHGTPRAIGGGDRDLRLFCRVHNHFVAGEFFGHEYMARFSRRAHRDDVENEQARSQPP